MEEEWRTSRAGRERRERSTSGTWPVLGRSWRGRQMEAIGWHCIELRRGTAWKGTVEWAENARCPNAPMQVRGVEVCF